MIWVVLVFFLLPAILPVIDDESKLHKVIKGVIIAVMVYIAIMYFLTDGCNGEDGMHYFVFAAWFCTILAIP